jgi:hypothetical protein
VLSLPHFLYQRWRFQGTAMDGAAAMVAVVTTKSMVKMTETGEPLRR